MHHSHEHLCITKLEVCSSLGQESCMHISVCTNLSGRWSTTITYCNHVPYVAIPYIQAQLPTYQYPLCCTFPLFLVSGHSPIVAKLSSSTSQDLFPTLMYKINTESSMECSNFNLKSGLLAS